MQDWRNKRITIMGLGLHGGGLAVTKFLAKQGAIVTVTDLKTKQQLKTSIDKLKNFRVKFVLGKHRLEDFEKADLVIQNPGVPRDSIYLQAARQHNVPIENEASLFFKLCPAPIIGITGTRGKSTTTSLVYQIYKKYNRQVLLAGNIRDVVMFDIINKVRKNTPVVLELSSWQLEVLDPYKLSPHIGLITNVMPDHLNRYKNFQAYVQAKKIIFSHQTAEDYVVLNLDNPVTKTLGQQVTSQRYWFSQKYFAEVNGTYVKNKQIYFRKNGQEIKVCAVADIRLAGEHNLANALAAITLSKIAGIPNQIIKSVLQSFKGLANRQQLIRTYKQINFYNDTTATTPDATMAALKTLKELKKNSIVLIAGGSDKKLVYDQLAKMIKQDVRALILFQGEATAKLVKELKKINFTKTMIFVKSMPEAFVQAKYLLQPKDVLLLSPAAASFGLFVNEFDRGYQFNKEVGKFKI